MRAWRFSKTTCGLSLPNVTSRDDDIIVGVILRPFNSKGADRGVNLEQLAESLVRYFSQPVSQGIPELVEAMDSGRLSISAAAEIAGAEPEVQRAVVARGERESTWAAREIRRER